MKVSYTLTSSDVRKLKEINREISQKISKSIDEIRKTDRYNTNIVDPLLDSIHLLGEMDYVLIDVTE